MSSGESICFSTTGRSIFFLVPKSSVSSKRKVRNIEDRKTTRRVEHDLDKLLRDNYQDYPSRHLIFEFIHNLYRNVHKRVFVSTKLSKFPIAIFHETNYKVVVVTVAMVVVMVMRYRCEKKHYFYARITRTAKKRKGTVYQPRFSH